MTSSRYRLDFSHRHLYTGKNAITIPVTLISDRAISTDLIAILDTGSTYCIFARAYADLLGLNLTSGAEEKIRTATGSFYCYGHEVTVSVFDLE